MNMKIRMTVTVNMKTGMAVNVNLKTRMSAVAYHSHVPYCNQNNHDQNTHLFFSRLTINLLSPTGG